MVIEEHRSGVSTEAGLDERGGYLHRLADSQNPGCRIVGMKDRHAPESTASLDRDLHLCAQSRRRRNAGSVERSSTSWRFGRSEGR